MTVVDVKTLPRVFRSLVDLSWISQKKNLDVKYRGMDAKFQ